jgi:hypothetical protein
MVKTEMRCPDCGGRIVAVRDLETDKVELEEYHLPGCPAVCTVLQHSTQVSAAPAPGHNEARGFASQPALWAHRRERSE